jgi:hypothetical protein
MATNPHYEALLESIKTTTSLIHTLNKDLKDNEVGLATIKARLDAVDEVTHVLTGMVRDGNGCNSIMTRLALMEGNIATLTDRDTHFRKFVYSKFEEVRDDKREEADKNGKFNRKKILNLLKIVPGVVALIALLVEHLIK